jgi:hypothetical protein
VEAMPRYQAIKMEAEHQSKSRKDSISMPPPKSAPDIREPPPRELPKSKP